MISPGSNLKTEPATGSAAGWPRNAPFGIWLTHDVDRVRKTYQYATDILTRHKLPNLVPLVRGDDPYFNFARILALEESLGVKSTFFFLQESLPFRFSPRNLPRALGKYSFSEPRVAWALRELHTRGWEIGLHGSYRSYRDENLLRTEKEELEAALGSPVLGIRQHYLNLEIPATWQLQEKVGFKYDATFGQIGQLGFPDDCYLPFRPAGCNLLVIPLVLSDAAVLRQKLTPREAEAKIRLILKEASEHRALVTVLWHQRFLNPNEFPGQWALYRWVIELGLSMGAWFGTGADVLPLCR